MNGFSVFEYCYRDAANFKSWGQLLLEGIASELLENKDVQRAYLGQEKKQLWER